MVNFIQYFFQNKEKATDLECGVPPPSDATNVSPGLFWGAVHGVGNAVGGVCDMAGRVVHAVGDGVAGAQKKAMEAVHGVAKWAIFAEQEQKEFKDHLERLGGDQCLAQTIDALGPRLAREMMKVAENHPYGGYLKPLYEGEEDFLDHLLRTSLLRVMSNVALRLEREAKLKRGPLETSPVQIPHLTLKVLSALAGIVKNGFEGIAKGGYDQIASMEDEGQKKAGLLALFTPVADEILRVGFPEGAADLKINRYVQERVFRNVRDGLASFLLSIYPLVYPHHHTEEQLAIFQEENGGKALEKIVKAVADRATPLSRQLIKEHREFIVGFLDPLLSGSEKKSVGEHLISELEQLADSSDPTIQWIFDVVHANVESFTLCVLGQLAITCSDSTEKNVTTKALKNLLAITTDFFGDQERAGKFKEIDGLEDPKERQNQKEILFAPFVETFLEKTGLRGNPLVEKCKSFLPGALAVLYEEAKKTFSLDPVVADPKPSVLDPKPASDEKGEAKTESPAGSVPVPAHEVVGPPIPEGVEVVEAALPKEVLDTLKAGCGTLSKTVREIILHFVQDQKNQVGKLFSDCVGVKDSKAEQEFSDALATLLSSGENIEGVLDFGEKILQKTLYDVLVLLGEKGKREAGDRDPVAVALHGIVFLLTERIPFVESKIKELHLAMLSEQERVEALAPFFVSDAEKLLSGVSGALPLPERIRPFLMDALGKTILPQLMGRIYLDLTSDYRSMGENGMELEKLAPETPKGIKVIADYIEKYIPHYLRENADKIADFVMKTGGHHLDFLDSKKEAVQQFLGKQVTEVAKDQEMNPVWKGVALLARGFLTKTLLSTFINLDRAESYGKSKDNNPLLLDLLCDVMKVGKNHFQWIHELQNGGKAYELSHKDLLQKFQEKGGIHPALEIDLREGVSEEERKACRLDKFFKPLAKDLIEISGFDKSKDFPVPDLLKDCGWDLLQDKILPEILMTVYDEMQKPENIDQMAINLIDLLAKADDLASSIEEPAIPLDSSQKELNEEIGNFIQSLAKLLPGSAAKALMGVKKIKNMSAEALGDIVRRQTNATSLLKLIDIVMGNLEKLKLPGEEEVRNPEEIARENLQKSKLLRNKMTEFVSHRMKKTTRNWISNKWESFQKKFDQIIAKYLRFPGTAVKKVLDWIFGSILRFIVPLFDFFIFGICWLIVKPCIRPKVAEVIEDSKMKIHENMLFKMTESVVGAIRNGLRKAKGQPSSEGSPSQPRGETPTTAQSERLEVPAAEAH